MDEFNKFSDSDSRETSDYYESDHYAETLVKEKKLKNKRRQINYNKKSKK